MRTVDTFVTWMVVMLANYWYLKDIDTTKILTFEEYEWYFKNIDTFDTWEVLILLLLEEFNASKVLLHENYWYLKSNVTAKVLTLKKCWYHRSIDTW